MSRPKGSKNKPKIERENKSAQIPQDPDDDIEEIANELEVGLNQEGLTLKPDSAIEGIIINNNWKIMSDPLNVILMHRRSKTHRRSKPGSPDNWEQFYYSNITNALQAMVDKEILGTGLKDLETVNQKIEELKTTIANLPIPHGIS